MAGHAERRILLVGKTGVGKSCTGNTILGKNAFEAKSSSSSFTTQSSPEKMYTNKKMMKVIDTPGFFGKDPDDQNREIARSIVECTPGPDAVVIVLKVERYTKHEEETVELITKTFTADVFKYAIVLFTHGYDLKGKTIAQFVKENDKLQELIDKCGGRCHVIDNEHWKHNLLGYKSNRIQVGKLLNTIEKLVEENDGKHYWNEFLQAVDTDIQSEIRRIKEENKENLSDEEISEQAKDKVSFKIMAAGCATGVLLGAVLGIPVLLAAGMYLGGRELFHGGVKLKDLLHILSKKVGALEHFRDATAEEREGLIRGETGTSRDVGAGAGAEATVGATQATLNVKAVCVAIGVVAARTGATVGAVAGAGAAEAGAAATFGAAAAGGTAGGAISAGVAAGIVAGVAGAAGKGAVGAGAAGATAALGSTAVEATAIAAGATAAEAGAAAVVGATGAAAAEAGAAATVGAAGAGAGAAAEAGAVGTVGAAGGAISAGVAAGIGAGVAGCVMVVAGAVAGGVIGVKAAKGADSPGEAAEMAKDAIFDQVKHFFRKKELD